MKAPYSLEQYESINEWDHGYLVVMAKYKHLNERELRKIQLFIKENYKEMYLKWVQYSENGYYGDGE